ncbi:MAG: class I SAM-dependent methyltransferase [Thermoanaerobaculia bacterium]
MTESLRNISDTALWVAQYRVMETERPDALFKDPLARKLVGDRGREIVRNMKVTGFAWPMIVRTHVMDEIILRSIAQEGVDCVLNLAAGLDTRPYRLPLPKTLRWIEADLPEILAYKSEKLSGETPVCRFERVAADLTDAAARRGLFVRAAQGSRNVLTVTEGLLAYLSPDQVGALADDLHSPPAMRQWLIDIASPRLKKMLDRKVGKHISAANAPFKFAPAESTKFFEPHGWKEREFRSTFEEGLRLHRTMRMAWLWVLLGRLQPLSKREEMRRIGGIVLLDRT